MRYFVTATIEERIFVVAEVAADVNPDGDTRYVFPHGLAKEVADWLEAEISPEVLTSETLASTPAGTLALARWRAGDDADWEDARKAFNLAEALPRRREDLEMMAGKGDVDAALLLREGSYAQWCEHLRAGADRGF